MPALWNKNCARGEKLIRYRKLTNRRRSQRQPSVPSCRSLLVSAFAYIRRCNCIGLRGLYEHLRHMRVQDVTCFLDYNHVIFVVMSATSDTIAGIDH